MFFKGKALIFAIYRKVTNEFSYLMRRKGNSRECFAIYPVERS